MKLDRISKKVRLRDSWLQMLMLYNFRHLHPPSISRSLASFLNKQQAQQTDFIDNFFFFN